MTSAMFAVRPAKRDFNPSIEEDILLIAALMGRRRGAAEYFARRHDAFLRAAVLSSSSIARAFLDDLTHEVYAHLWRNDFRVLRRWRQDVPLRAYLRSIVKRLTWERLGGFLPRGEQLDGGLPRDLHALGDPAVILPANPEEGLVAHEAMRLVEQALASLDDKHRQVIELRYYGDLSYREIAETLAITPSNAGVRLTRALTHLKARLLDLAAREVHPPWALASPTM